jgi:hypothetical protein
MNFECLSEYGYKSNTYFTITQLVKLHTCLGINKVRKANDMVYLVIVNVAEDAFIKTVLLLLRYSRTNKIYSTSILGHKTY